MKLRLERPLVFFDLETTGLDVKTARIVEIALLKIFPDKKNESFLTRVNPEIPIPSDATRIHGINNLDVMDKPTFREIATDVFAFIRNSDLAGYNLVSYDVPILINELNRAGIEYSTESVRFVDVLTIFRLKEKRDLSAAYRFYCNKQLEGAHSAFKDTQATFEILQAQAEKYPDLPLTVEELHQFCRQQDDRFVDVDRKFYWQNDYACFSFGRYKGHSLNKVATDDPDYLSWMLNQDFSIEVQTIIRSALKGSFPQKPPAVASKNG
ncbi:MAG: 3'-5' exonuclease [bacterium]|nr:3'-5' exonuclease [bacterium]